MGKLGADYDRWVHEPIVQKEAPRFFESDIAEVKHNLFLSVASFPTKLGLRILVPTLG